MSSMNMVEDVPSRTAIEKELLRICASNLFRLSVKQSEVLELVVRSALDNQVLTQKEIGFRLFTNYTIDSPIVRVTFNLLRSRLKEYYETTGREDIVFIDLPVGAYKPVFSYSAQSDNLRNYRKGIACLRDLNSLGTAVDYFERSVDDNPEFAPGYASLAEAELLLALIRDVYHSPREKDRWVVDPEPYLGPGSDAANMALQLDGGLWLPHIVLGILHVLNNDFVEARMSFEKATEIDGARTRDCLWYAAYLLTIGRQDEALEIGRSRTMIEPEDALGALGYALFLYVCRSYEAALIALKGAYRSETFPFARLLNGLVLLEVDDQNATYSIVEAAGMLSNFSWTAQLPDNTHATQVPSLLFAGMIYLCNKRFWSREQWFTPLQSVTHRMKQVRALENMVALETAEYVRPLNRIFVHLADGRIDRAMPLLRAAYGKELFAFWFHLWPFLEPLRDDNRYKRMVRRLNDRIRASS